MIEYAKVILPEVCFWEDLFEKELLKCIGWTEVNEMDKLFTWCYNTFGEMHPDILVEAFVGTTCKISNTKSFTYPIKLHKIRILHNKTFDAA